MPKYTVSDKRVGRKRLYSLIDILKRYSNHDCYNKYEVSD